MRYATPACFLCSNTCPQVKSRSTAKYRESTLLHIPFRRIPARHDAISAAAWKVKRADGCGSSAFRKSVYLSNVRSKIQHTRPPGPMSRADSSTAFFPACPKFMHPGSLPDTLIDCDRVNCIRHQRSQNLSQPLASG